MISISALDVGDQQGAQLVGDLGAHAEPFLEARHRLMQQHAQAIDGGRPRARRCREQGRDEGT